MRTFKIFENSEQCTNPHIRNLHADFNHTRKNTEEAMKNFQKSPFYQSLTSDGCEPKTRIHCGVILIKKELNNVGRLSLLAKKALLSIPPTSEKVELYNDGIINQLHAKTNLARCKVFKAHVIQCFSHKMMFLGMNVLNPSQRVYDNEKNANFVSNIHHPWVHGFKVFDATIHTNFTVPIELSHGADDEFERVSDF